MSIDQDIDNNARQLAIDVKINHDITNGDENTEVATEGGPVPSIRKRLKDIENEWAKTADPLADDLASTVQVIKEYKNDAANSATLAEETLPKVIAEGDQQVERIINESGQQVNQVQSEGQQQEALVNTAGATQVNNVENAGKTAEQAAHQAQSIANKFGNVDVAVTVATEQADRSKTEADRAEKAVTDVITETEEQIKEIQAVGAEQVNAINSKSAEQVAIVTATGAEQSEMVVLTGAEQAQTLEVTGSQEKLEINQLADGRIDDINAVGADLDILVDRAETANTQANTAATEAKKAEANATAIVHNDEGSLTPKPGAYAVADSNGHYNIGWTPLLAAMYPHSGVLGNVDKNDMFEFSANVPNLFAWKANLNKPIPRFNIAGRFVVPKGTQHDYEITLQDAESTAKKAIAFDDIFLDWNGNVRTYRSITPHRTTTSFNRDEIAKEHGYSKIKTGLYKTSDTYALLLGRIARLNKGVYHPVFNQEGARWPLATSSTIQYWYQDKAIKLTNFTDAFNISNSTDGTVGPGGYMNSGDLKLGRSGRPDKKLYDAIYADDFTPLYYSAKNFINCYTLTTNSLNKIVNNNTFSAAEGLQNRVNGILASIVVESILNNKEIVVSGIEYTNTITPNQNIEVSGYIYSNSQLVSRIGYIFANRNLRITHGIEYLIQKNKYKIVFFERLKSENDTKAQINGIAIENLPVQKEFSYYGKTDAARPKFQMIDIIGAQGAWPEEWKSHGLPGNYLDLSEEGQILIPDNNTKFYKASRKCLKLYKVLSTRNNGQAWQELTNTWKAQLESPNNGITAKLFNDQVIMIFYQTSANPFESTLRSTLINLTDGYFSNYFAKHLGSVLCSNLINKIPTATGNEPDFNFYFPMTKITINETGKMLQCSHAPLEITRSVPGFKAISYLSVENSQLFLNICYKEIKVKNNVLGDDNLLIAYDKQTIETDLNGENVLVGTKRAELPFIFNGVTY